MMVVRGFVVSIDCGLSCLLFVIGPGCSVCCRLFSGVFLGVSLFLSGFRVFFCRFSWVLSGECLCWLVMGVCGCACKKGW